MPIFNVEMAPIVVRSNGGPYTAVSAGLLPIPAANTARAASVEYSPTTAAALT